MSNFFLYCYNLLQDYMFLFNTILFFLLLYLDFYNYLAFLMEWPLKVSFKHVICRARTFRILKPRKYAFKYSLKVENMHLKYAIKK